MQTPEARRQWIKGVVAGRTFGSHLSVWDYPEQSAKDVAFHEALGTFVAGLHLSTVLDAYAACEIYLVETIAAQGPLRHLSTVTDEQMLVETWEQSMNSARALPSMKPILGELRKQGIWIGTGIPGRLLKLGNHKNDLAHYRQFTITDVERTDASSWTGRVTAAPAPADPGVRLDYAMNGIGVMLDLWFAELRYFPPTQYPGDDWVPSDKRQ